MIDGRIGPYRLVRLLGRGAMGEVHLAEDSRSGAVVALKVLSRVRGLRSRSVQRFLVEANAVAALEHPGIVRFVETGEYDGVRTIALEHVDGPSLAEVLERRAAHGPRPLVDLVAGALGPLSPESLAEAEARWFADVARLGEDVARALHAAHERGVLHRDVKPGNVLVERDGRPRLVDFGLARIAGGGRITFTGEFVGTADYASPEQVNPLRGAAQPASDVFSLGATLFECLVGEPPFGSGHTLEVIRRIRNVEAPDPRSIAPEIPPPLAAIVRRCLEKPLDRRYATAAALADDLARFREGRPLAPMPDAPRERTPSSRANAVALAVAATLVAAALVFALVPRRTGVPSDPHDRVLRLRAAAEGRPFVSAAELDALVDGCRDLGPPEIETPDSLELAWGLLESGAADGRAAAWRALERAKLVDLRSAPEELRESLARFLEEWRR